MKKWGIAAVFAAAALTACSAAGNTGEGTGESRTEQAVTAESAAERVEEAEEPIDAEVSAEYWSQWAEGGEIIHAGSDSIDILTAGCDELAAVLDERGRAAEEEVKRAYDELLPEAVRRDEEGETGCWVERSVELVRCDSRIFSFTEAGSSYTGGAHPSYWESGVNLDPGSGETLSLRDVASDYDGVCGALRAVLEREYGEKGLFEGWEETLEEMCYGDGSIDGCWTMDREGLKFSFSPYLLAPYSSGVIRAELAFQEYPGMVREEYVPEGGFARRIDPEEPETVDGAEGEIRLTCLPDEEAYMTRVCVCSGGMEAETEAYGTFQEAYLMRTAEGRTYLYAEFTGDNDYRTNYVFDVNGEPAFVGRTEAVFLDHLAQDPGRLTLYTRLDALGTYVGYRQYRVGEDGMPVPLEGAYRVGKQWGTDGYTLTARIPVPVWTADGEEEIRQLLPAGTKFLVRGTDGETFVEMELEDGSRCRVRIERQDYLSEIEGAAETEYFEGLFYAG